MFFDTQIHKEYSILMNFNFNEFSSFCTCHQAFNIYITVCTKCISEHFKIFALFTHIFIFRMLISPGLHLMVVDSGIIFTKYH